MALLFHSPDEDAAAWRTALLRHEPGSTSGSCWRSAKRPMYSTPPCSAASPRFPASLLSLCLIPSAWVWASTTAAHPSLPHLPGCLADLFV